MQNWEVSAKIRELLIVQRQLMLTEQNVRELEKERRHLRTSNGIKEKQIKLLQKDKKFTEEQLNNLRADNVLIANLCTMGLSILVLAAWLVDVARAVA